MSTLLVMGLPLGGRSTAAGFLGLQAKIKQQFGDKVTILVYVGERVENIIQMLHEQYPGWDLIVGGYSWGADNTSIIAAKSGRAIKFLFALQPSVYYPTTPLGPNVKEALCVYNPWWFETMGLGFQRLTLAPGNTTTQLTMDAEHDSHPYVQSDPQVWAKVLAGIGRAVA